MSVVALSGGNFERGESSMLSCLLKESQHGWTAFFDEVSMDPLARKEKSAYYQQVLLIIVPRSFWFFKFLMVALQPTGNIIPRDCLYRIYK